MKLPVSPARWNELVERHASQLASLLSRRIGPEVRGEYEHWDRLRHLTPPVGLTVEQWWLCIKFARVSLSRELPLIDRDGKPFTLALSDSIQRRLFMVVRDAAGALLGDQPAPADAVRQHYLMRSLMEEAMTSSQLEGAATTTQVAKEMLRTQRQPRDYGERMIWNNYAAMRELRRWQQRPLTPEAVFEIHRMLTDGTLKDPDSAGRFRRAGEEIVIEDETGNVLHVPPAAQELPQRLRALCDFANQSDQDQHFVHPVVRAIVIHFQIGYDHPFCDGNGRTARALFYWSMLRSGFWMAPYLSISSVLKHAPAQYVRSHLYTESDDGDLTYFISHQLDVLIKAIVGVHGYIERKQHTQQEVETLLKPGGRLARALNHRQRALLLNACRHPGKQFTIDEHRRAHDIAYQTARTDLLTLVDAELMEQYRQGRAFYFVARPDLAEKLGSD